MKENKTTIELLNAIEIFMKEMEKATKKITLKIEEIGDRDGTN